MALRPLTGDRRTLIAGGMGVDRALQAAVIAPLTDKPDMQVALRDRITAGYG